MATPQVNPILGAVAVWCVAAIAPGGKWEYGKSFVAELGTTPAARGSVTPWLGLQSHARCSLSVVVRIAEMLSYHTDGGLHADAILVGVVGV